MSYAEKRDGKLTGYWYGEVRIKATGQSFRKRFDTKKLANGYEAYVKAAGVEPESSQDIKDAGPTFKEMATLMLSKKKVKDRAGAGRLAYIISRIGAKTLPGITTTVLDELVETLEKRPAQMKGKERITDGTINRYLAEVSGVFTWAIERDDHRDLKPPTIPWRKEAGRRIHWFTEAQEAVVVKWLQGQGWLPEALSMRVLCATGMRWGEFSSLEPHQCQPEWVLLDETKTDTPRDVPIDEALARELKALVGSKAVPDYETMRIRVRLAVKACGYSDKLGIHNMRHSTATRLVKRGVPLPVVQKFLGHKDIRTTMKYVHVEGEDLMAALKKLYPQRVESVSNTSTDNVVPLVKSTG